MDIFLVVDRFGDRPPCLIRGDTLDKMLDYLQLKGKRVDCWVVSKTSLSFLLSNDLQMVYLRKVL